MSELYKIIEIDKDLYCLQEGNVNLYLIIGDNKALLFDTAYGFNDYRLLIRSISDKPLIVVNSHGDIDHCLGNYLFDSVFIHAQDLFQLRGLDDKELKEKMASFFPEYLSEESKKAWMDHSVFECRYDLISQGDVFDLGNRMLEVFEIPGHTRGSIALIDRANGLLFAGDAISRSVNFHDDPKHGRECASLLCYYDALNKLKKDFKNLKTIYACHYELGTPPERIDELMRSIEDIYEDPSQDIYEQNFVGIGLYRHYSPNARISYSQKVLENLRAAGRNPKDLL